MRVGQVRTRAFCESRSDVRDLSRSPRVSCRRMLPREGTSEPRVRGGQVRTFGFCEAGAVYASEFSTFARDSPARASTRKQASSQGRPNVELLRRCLRSYHAHAGDTELPRLVHLGSDANSRALACSVARTTAMRARRTCTDRATGKRFSECRSAWLSGSLGAARSDGAEIAHERQPWPTCLRSSGECGVSAPIGSCCSSPTRPSSSWSWTIA